ncbi:hypothetical protein [Stenotrophomonas sp. MMGLT7]|uniref:hypothetical protein n=1 Tax=Stenotrophomonas sp. MMGLT7 TaxID=2901227 RepID=UPI001E631CA7|nr:hypothetical protein [Stenotrophomonas sp. MMGLT7]
MGDSGSHLSRHALRPPLRIGCALDLGSVVELQNVAHPGQGRSRWIDETELLVEAGHHCSQYGSGGDGSGNGSPVRGATSTRIDEHM